MVGIKRPAVVFAAVFLLSALMTGYGFSFICCIFAILLIPFLFFGLAKTSLRKACFILLLIFSLLYPSFYRFVFTDIQNKSYDELKDKHSFTATVSEISYHGSSVFISADIKGENGKNMGKATLTKAFPQKLPDLYDVIHFEGDIYPINNETVNKLSLFRNENYYFSKGCFYAANVENIKVSGRPEKQNANLIHKYYFYICDNLKNKFPIYDGTDTFSYVLALLTGNRSLIPDKTYDAFSRSGLIPYLCISGLHVAISSGILIFILEKFRCNRYLKLVLLFSFLFFLCLITGFSGSVVRASVMSAIVLVGSFLKRKSDKFTSLSIALAVVVFINPFSVFDFGTQLSFIAMLGLCNSSYLTGDFFEFKTFFTKIKNIIVSGFVTSGFVAIPILNIFGGVLLLNPLSSLLAVIFTPMMFLLTLSAFLAFLPETFLCFLTYPASFLIVIFEKTAIAFSKIPYAYAEFDCPALFYTLFLFMLFANIFFISFKKDKYIAFSGVLFTVFVYANILIMHIFNIICG